MTKLINRAQILGKEEIGATAVEYGIMIALIVMATFITIRALGTSLSTLFSDLAVEMQGF